MNLKGMVLNMDYNLEPKQDENGLWWVYNFDTVLGGFGSFETQEQAERVIMLFDKTKVGNLV